MAFELINKLIILLDKWWNPYSYTYYYSWYSASNARISIIDNGRWEQFIIEINTCRWSGL